MRANLEVHLQKFRFQSPVLGGSASTHRSAAHAGRLLPLVGLKAAIDCIKQRVSGAQGRVSVSGASVSENLPTASPSAGLIKFPLFFPSTNSRDLRRHERTWFQIPRIPNKCKHCIIVLRCGSLCMVSLSVGLGQHIYTCIWLMDQAIMRHDQKQEVS